MPNSIDYHNGLAWGRCRLTSEKLYPQSAHDAAHKATAAFAGLGLTAQKGAESLAKCDKEAIKAVLLACGVGMALREELKRMENSSD